MTSTIPVRRVGDFALLLAEIAWRAGAAILEARAAGIAVAHKADDTPVTEADRRAEEIILAGLADAIPDLPVISEEAAARGETPQIGEQFLLVDPLDGTREFIAGRDEFTVNIALIEGGRPAAGVVLAPGLGVLALADAEGAVETRLEAGATLGSSKWRRLATRPLRAAGPVAVASRSHRDAETDAFLAERGVSDVRSAGSSLKFIVIARGEADLYPRFGRTMEWDTAAGHAVLSAAGGAVATADGRELTYGKRASGYANPPFIAWGRRPVYAGF